MTKTSLTIARVGLILWLIAQIIYTASMWLFSSGLLTYSAFLFLCFAVLLANFVFQYFDQAYDSTLAKVTFIMTMIGVIGLLVAGILLLVGLITWSPVLLVIGGLIGVFIAPALLVFYLLWGITFIVIRERVDNSSLMLAGGILFTIGAVSSFFFGLLAFLAVIGLLLVTIVMFGEGSGS